MDRIQIQLGVILLLIGCNFANIIQDPLSIDVKRGADGTLACVFDTPANDCYWTKDHNPIKIDDHRYKYTGVLDNGNCSISITASDEEQDDGYWQCGIAQSSDYQGSSSKIAKYTVIVQPQEPVLYLNGNQIQNKSQLASTDFQFGSTILCQSVDGNPASNLILKMGRSGIVLDANYTVTNGSQPKLLTSNLNYVWQSDSRFNMNNEVLVCAAEHTSYNSTKHFVYAYIGSILPPQQVVAVAEGFSSSNIDTTTDVAISLTCTAQSVFPIKYEWLKRSSDNDKWQTFANEQNTSFRAFTTQLMCQAWVTEDVNMTKSSSNVLIIVAGGSKSASTGAIVGIVIGVLVAIFLLVAGAYYLYRNKMWCFKVPRQTNYEDAEHGGNLNAKVIDSSTKQVTPTFVNREQTQSLLNDSTGNKDTYNSEETHPIIYADLQLQSPKNRDPPQNIATEYASLKRPYGIQ